MNTTIHTTDYHTAGEPFRIVENSPLSFPGQTVAERRIYAMEDTEIEQLRQTLCYEPRGHADMYGGFITPPDDEGADFGVLFWHKDGFSTACGHGTIALGVWAVETGRVPSDPEGTTDVVIDVPSGRVTAKVRCRGGKITSVDFINVPSYVLAERIPVSTSWGEVSVDVSFGGAIYAQLDAASLGLEVTPENITKLIDVGREIKWKLNSTEYAAHPTDDRLNGVYGTIIYEDLGFTDQGHIHQRNVAIFADGEVDRSPCGSGTATRVATLTTQGILPSGRKLIHDSIVNSRFEASVREVGSTKSGRPSFVTQVTGMAYKTGQHTFEVNPDDPMIPGFVLR